jgi:hypothetical protein
MKRLSVASCWDRGSLLGWALVVLGTVLGCTSQTAISQNGSGPYVSVWAQLYPESLKKTLVSGSLLGEFTAAAKARDELTALERWESFLDEFEPEDGYFEDAMHVRLVEWARMELVRLQLRLSGDHEAEDALIAKMRRVAESMDLR